MTSSHKISLITGGASGIGQTMTRHLANQNCTVVILDVNEAGLAETAVSMPNIIPFYCDVTDAEMVKQVIKKVETTVGPVDRFVHCAAVMPGGLLHDMSPEKINQVMQINYCGMVNATQAMLPYMRQRNSGEFIVLGSIAGVVPMVKFGAYGATKAATNFYMQVLMQENEDTNINFQLVCPSAVDTPLIDQVVDAGPQMLKEAKATGKNMDTPEAIVASIEKGLVKNKRVNYPGIANTTQIAYRLFPGLLSCIGKKMAS